MSDNSSVPHLSNLTTYDNALEKTIAYDRSSDGNTSEHVEMAMFEPVPGDPGHLDIASKDASDEAKDDDITINISLSLKEANVLSQFLNRPDIQAILAATA